MKVQTFQGFHALIREISDVTKEMKSGAVHIRVSYFRTIFMPIRLLEVEAHY